jgi:hypothetical protein
VGDPGFRHCGGGRDGEDEPGQDGSVWKRRGRYKGDQQITP